MIKVRPMTEEEVVTVVSEIRDLTCPIDDLTPDQRALVGGYLATARSGEIKKNDPKLVTVVGIERMTGKPSLWDSLHPGREGRPKGTELRAREAEAKILEAVDKLNTPPDDPRTQRMLEKIMRFV